MTRPARTNVPYARYEDPQGVRDITARELYHRDNQPDRPLGYATPTIRTTPRSVTFDDMALVDAEAAGGAVVIRLPPISPQDVSKGLSVVLVSSTGAITVVPRPGDLINGGTTARITQQWGAKVFVALSANTWLAYSESPTETGVTARTTPFWQWNGSDLSQFGTPQHDTSVTAHAESVVAAAGANWVQMSVTSDGSSGAADRNHTVMLPITVTPPSADYFVTADAHVSTFPAANRFDVGFVVRWAAGAVAPAGTGYALYRQNDAGSMEISRWNDAVSSGRGTNTLLRTFPVFDANGVTTDLFSPSAKVSAETQLDFSAEGVRLGVIETAGTFTAAGQPGLLAGIGSGGTGSVTAVVRFRNIRCYELPQDAI